MSAVLFEKKPPIAFVTINRPEAMNALNGEVQQGLRDAWEKVEEDDEIMVAIITGAGPRAFSAGADLKDAARRGGEGRRVGEGANARPALPNMSPSSGPSVSNHDRPGTRGRT